MPKNKPKTPGPFAPVPVTLERRSVLEWLGKATVLALGGGLAAACVRDGKGAPSFFDGDAGPDGGTDGRWIGVADLGCGPDDFPFSPGPKDHAVYEDWGERTVDPQDLVEILQGWSLSVDGLVEHPLQLGFADLLALPRQDQLTDFHCVEGWSVHDVPWNGVHLRTLLDLAQPQTGATHITFHCQGGIYRESLPLEVALEDKTLLAFGIDCATLPLSTGFPLRLVVPRKWAYKSAKYLTRLELVDGPVQGFWEQFGYPYDADVPESRLREGKY
jgi:hypothetical protein